MNVEDWEAARAARDRRADPRRGGGARGGGRRLGARRAACRRARSPPPRVRRSGSTASTLRSVLELRLLDVLTSPHGWAAQAGAAPATAARDARRRRARRAAIGDAPRPPKSGRAAAIAKSGEIEQEAGRVRAAVDERDHAEHAAEHLVGDLLLRGRVEQHVGEALGGARSRPPRDGDRHRAGRRRAGGRRAGRRARRACSPRALLPHRDARERGADAIEPTAKPIITTEKPPAPCGASARTSVGTPAIQQPVVIVIATPKVTTAVDERAPRAERRDPLAQPRRLAVAPRGRGPARIRRISSAETKNVAASTAKNVRERQEREQHAPRAPSRRSRAPAPSPATSAFAGWTFSRSTTAGIVAP